MSRSGIDGSMSGSSGVELPFDVVYGWVRNGEDAYATQVKQNLLPAALWMGGFALNQDELQSVSDAAGVTIPPNWKAVQMTADGGKKEYAICVNRTVTCTPFGMRESWVNKDDRRRAPEYFDGARMHVQVLAYLAYGTKNGGDTVTYKPWVPSVLSAKGHQAKYLKTAFMAWKKEAKKVLAKVPELGDDPWSFWLPPIGTFGDKPVIEMVGSGANKSPITPVKLGLPQDKLAPEFLQARVLAPDFAEQLQEMNAMAQEWLQAWAQPYTEDANGRGNGNGNRDDNVPPHNPHPPSGPGYSDEDDIPF